MVNKTNNIMKRPSHITVCGHFAEGQRLADGQTVKTQVIVQALKDMYGPNTVSICDTYRWTRNPFKMLLNSVRAARGSSDVIILPADKGVFIFVPLFSLLAKKYNTRIHYSVIGGWLHDRLKKSPFLVRYLRNFTTIQVETNLMKSELDELGINNVYVIPNFKTINALSKDEVQSRDFEYPLPLCTFSRVEAKKGIEDAIKVVMRINSESDKPIYTLDIYGAVSKDFEPRFQEIMKSSSPEITYKGVVESSKSVEVLKNYYLLLFPTLYTTEGLPGTIIDGYAAGLPVLSSIWESFNDVIVEGKTGYGMKLGDNQSFHDQLMRLKDTELVFPLRGNCLEAFEPYSYNQGCTELKNRLELRK